jgi:hypothetical protein
MKRVIVCLLAALACAGIGRASYRADATRNAALSKYVPASPLIYLEAKDFSSLLNGWNSSAQKKAWVPSDNYEVFSRSRLFLRLKGAAEQFAVAAGLPPDMDFLSQIAGEHSALAVYDIGKLQFLYITDLPSAKSMQTALWQTRAKFEPRNAGGTDFYLRRDPESQREVAFAVSGDYLLLATQEDLMASALQLMSGKQGRSVEDDPSWAAATTAAERPGDLRMVLDLKDLVPNGYFRTYWVQQNVTDLSQYSAAVSDLFRSDKEYREERVLIRKKESDHATTAEGAAAVADLARLIPDTTGVYGSIANPSGASCFTLLETKLFAPHSGKGSASQLAPQVQLTSGEIGGSADLETRIDQPPPASNASQAGSELKELLYKNPILASLQVQSSWADRTEVFVHLHSAIVLVAASDWNESEVKSAVAAFPEQGMTAGKFGMGWTQKSGYVQLDGLWPIAISTRGKYLIAADDSALMESIVANFSRKAFGRPLALYAGFRHDRERDHYAQFMGLIDHSKAAGARMNGSEGQPQFFSGNVASLSAALSDVSSERIEIRSEAEKVRQTVTYEWSR